MKIALFCLVAALPVFTGCSAGLRGDAGLSVKGGQLSAQGAGAGWGAGAGSGGARVASGGSASGSVGGGINGGASGGAAAGGGVAGGVAGGAQGRGAASGQGGAAAGGGMPAAPWVPVFYGIPLAGAREVVFVLDHSGSMAETSVGTMSGNPIAAAAAVGFQLMAGARSAQAFLPTAWPQGGQPSALAAAAAVQRQSKMDAAKSELVGALAALPDGTRFNIVFFNENVAAYSQQLVVMTPASRLQSISFVHTIGASGTTAAVPALRSAYAGQPSRVMFLSDGLANTGGTRDQLLAEARLEMRKGVRFDTVGVGTDQDAPLMRSLAAESGGQWAQR